MRVCRAVLERGGQRSSFPRRKVIAFGFANVAGVEFFRAWALLKFIRLIF